VAVTLFFWGTYLLTEAIGDPLRPTEVAVLVAGFMLASACFLMVFLVRPRGRRATAGDEDSDGDLEYASGPVLTVYSKTVQNQLEAKQVME
jgi:hypothetical protein